MKRREQNKAGPGWGPGLLGSALAALLLLHACEYRSPDSAAQREGVVLLPDSNLTIEDARLAPDRLPAMQHVYLSRGEEFSIRFPGTPRVSRSMIPSPQGQIELVTIAYDFSITKAYWASFSDYPGEALQDRTGRQILDDARQSIVDGLGASTVFEVMMDTVRLGYPAQRFRARDGHFHAVYELVLVRNRLYQLGVLRDGRYPLPQDIEAFFGGFQLLTEGS
jgi:hypothetical protein